MSSEPVHASALGERQQSPAGTLRRAGRALGLAAIVAAALLTFPNAIPWMIAFWLSWHTWAAFRGQAAWLPLLACIGILLAKRVYWAPGLMALVAVMLTAALARAILARRNHLSAAGTWWIAMALWAAWLLFTVDWRAAVSRRHGIEWKGDRPVVCLGDSLTSGLLPEPGYPDVLADMLTVPVVNLGESGINTRQALGMLPSVQEAHPQIVVLGIGGHDFLQGRSRAETQDNLERLVEGCRTLGAEVVLMEMPRGFMTDPYSGLEREIARRYDLQLISDTAIRQLVLWSPVSPPGKWLRQFHLSDDGIHPNRRGTRYLAETVADVLARMYGEQIRRGP